MRLTGPLGACARMALAALLLASGTWPVSATLGRADAAYALLLAEPSFQEEVDERFGSDQPARDSYLAALRLKAWMAAACGRWDDASAAELKDLLAGWSSRYLRTVPPGRPHGYGPVRVSVERAAGAVRVTAEVRSLVPRAAAGGGLLRLATLPPLPALAVEADRDDEAEAISATLRVPAPAPGARVEVSFLGYDVAATDGRRHRAVVERVLVDLASGASRPAPFPRP